jgi:hypothetical protein
MLKALVLAASALGLAAVGLAQENDPDLYISIDDQPGPWFLQRSTCTLAHNVNGNSIAVVRFRASMGVEIEFLDPDLRVRVDETAPFVVSVDGASEESLGIGIAEGDRQGYRLSAPDGMLVRISTGRLLEASTRGRTLLRLDLAGANRAVAAMEECILETAAAALANGNGMDPFANATDEDWENEFDPYGNGTVPEDWNGSEPYEEFSVPEEDGIGSIPNAM